MCVICLSFYSLPAPVEVDNLTYNIDTDVTNSTFVIRWAINYNATYDSFIIDISPRPTYFTSPKYVLVQSCPTIECIITELSTLNLIVVSLSCM